MRRQPSRGGCTTTPRRLRTRSALLDPTTGTRRNDHPAPVRRSGSGRRSMTPRSARKTATGSKKDGEADRGRHARARHTFWPLTRIPSASLRSGMKEGPGRFPGPRPSSTTSHCLTSFSSGGKGTRTPNPLLAKQVRYQLRHTPVRADSLHRIGVLRPLLLPAAIAAAEDSQSPRCKNCSPQQGEQSSHAAPSWMRGPKRT